jgi:glutamate--cysteine ligase
MPYWAIGGTRIGLRARDAILRAAMGETKRGAGASEQGMSEIRSEADLFAPFEAAFGTREQKIGLEAEKFGVHANGAPLLYHGPGGVQELFAELVSRFGWRAEGESAGAPPIALLRGSTSITLEPGSQLELSGSPLPDVHAILAEVETHRRELASLASAKDLHWLGLGFHPWAHPDDLDWVPKSRYVTMREYLPTRGRFGLDMMRRTATVQANFDIASERDAMRKLRVALALSPIASALFANSAVYEGVRRPIQSHRCEVWLDVDNDRAGLLPFAWREDASLGDYVRWALSVPMFILKRDGRAIPNTDQTFGQFLAHGKDGHRATLSDWEMHLNTLFPDVRLKKTLEVRSADSVPSRWSMALPALWTGVLYDDAALHAVGELLLPFGYEAWAHARAQIPLLGLRATVAGQPLQPLARRVLAIASEALARRARKNERGEDERVYLEPLAALVERGEGIGDAVLGDWSPEAPDARASLFARARY